MNAGLLQVTMADLGKYQGTEWSRD